MTRTHRMSGTPTYRSWLKMRERCLDPNSNRYHLYGGCGVTVCKEWIDSFLAFYRDMGERPEGMTLGRKNNGGPYCKDNCQWETPTQQARNRSTTVYIEHEGERLPLRVLAERIGADAKTLWQRLRRGKGLFDEARTDSTSGIRGVTTHRTGKKRFQAGITVKGKFTSLGYYATAEEAGAVYAKARETLKGQK